MRRCVIVGGAGIGNYDYIREQLREDDFMIYCDSGLKHLEALQTPPDLIVPISHCPFADRCEYCMEICREAMPEETEISKGHRCSCWLCHPDAPKVTSYYERRKAGRHE